MRKLNLETLVLTSGAHQTHEAMCVMEAVAYMAGEEWSDAPECACPVISSFLRRWNDDLCDDERQILKPLIPLLIGSKSSAEVEARRCKTIRDWFFRVQCAEWLELAGLTEQAKDARENGENAKWAAARNAARAAAWDASGAAARAAAWDASGAAVRAAAWNAARNAAWDASGAAAWDASGAASWAAARAAAWDALKPTKKKLQKSAYQLMEQCLEIR